VWEERKLPEDVMEVFIVGDVEDAEVGVLSDAPPDVDPDTGALQFLRIGLLLCEKVSFDLWIHVHRESYVHRYGEEHAAAFP
jgi:hypothetical protein